MSRNKNNVYDLGRSRAETNEQALERLFQKHGEPLRSYLLGRISSEADVDDLIQEVFSRLAKIDDLRSRLSVEAGERANRAFIFSAANNLLVDMERRKAVRRDYQSSEGAVDKAFELSPDVVVVAQQELELVKRAIFKLRPKWRQAFVSSRFKYMSYKEISEQMGVSEKQVQYYITNALAKLRKATVKIPPKPPEPRESGRECDDE